MTAAQTKKNVNPYKPEILPQHVATASTPIVVGKPIVPSQKIKGAKNHNDCPKSAMTRAHAPAVRLASVVKSADDSGRFVIDNAILSIRHSFKSSISSLFKIYATLRWNLAGKNIKSED